MHQATISTAAVTTDPLSSKHARRLARLQSHKSDYQDGRVTSSGMSAQVQRLADLIDHLEKKVY